MRIRHFISLKLLFSSKINEKLPLEKCVCLLWKMLTAWFSALKVKMTSSFVSAHGSHYAQIWLKGVDLKSATSVCNRLESVILLKVCKISAVQIIEEIFINYQRTLINKQENESDSRKEMKERT